MIEIWSTLAPLIIASAVLPLQIVVTLVLVRSSMRAAFAWVAGMTTIRLIQGILFGFVFSISEAKSQATIPGFIGGLMLALAALLYAGALRKAIAKEDADEDEPPPKWLAKAESLPPWAAFAAGAGYLAFNGKQAVFTLGAITAIADAHLAAKLSVLTYLVYIALAQAGQLAILALATSSSSRAASVLDEFTAWLKRNSRVIIVTLNLIFGTWFLFKALTILGVI